MPHRPLLVGAVAVDENGRRHPRHGGGLKRPRIGRRRCHWCRRPIARFIEPPVRDLRQIGLQIATAGSAAGVDQPDLGGRSGRRAMFPQKSPRPKNWQSACTRREFGSAANGETWRHLRFTWHPFRGKKSLPKVYLAFNHLVEKKQSPRFQKSDRVEVAHHQSWCRVFMLKARRPRPWVYGARHGPRGRESVGKGANHA